MFLYSKINESCIAANKSLVFYFCGIELGDFILGVGVGVGVGVGETGVLLPFILLIANLFVKNNNNNNNIIKIPNPTTIPSNFSPFILDKINLITGFIINVGINNNVNMNAYDDIFDQVPL